MPAFLNRGSLLAVQFRSPVFNASIVLLRTWNDGAVACGVDRVALFFAFARIFSYRRLILCAQLFCQPTGGAVRFSRRLSPGICETARFPAGGPLAVVYSSCFAVHTGKCHFVELGIGCLLFVKILLKHQSAVIPA
jgi:hypothetical protein